MYGGKYLGKFFPFIAWGTHWMINKNALGLLGEEGVDIGKEFPSLKLINIFEDFKGPDGAWIRGEYPDSNMTFNPDTEEGNAPKEAVRLLEKLVIALREKDLKVVAHEAAWLAHVVTDLLWPPHQVGHYKDYTSRFYFWKIRTDWYDGVTGSFWHKHDKHSKIEAKTTIAFWGRRIGPVSIDYSFIRKAKGNYFLVENYLKKKARRINKKKLYEKYILEGWNKEIKETIDQEIFPDMISTVATLWFLAYRLK